MGEAKCNYEIAVGTKASIEGQLRGEAEELEALQQRRTNAPLPLILRFFRQRVAVLHQDWSKVLQLIPATDHKRREP